MKSLVTIAAILIATPAAADRLDDLQFQLDLLQGEQQADALAREHREAQREFDEMVRRDMAERDKQWKAEQYLRDWSERQRRR